MFLKEQKKAQINYYGEMLRTVASLSGLFSESSDPYIQYRIAENLFCRAFGASNLSRSDCSADASSGKLGIGIKTFLDKNGASMQKIAEFNSEHNLFNNLPLEQKVNKISELRNERLESTKHIHGLENLIYHCITRKDGRILVFETPMESIDISNISNIKKKENSITFEDGKNEYSFNITKSTLLKRFKTENVLLDLPVEILEDPYESLEKMFKSARTSLIFNPVKDSEHIFLPLYSTKSAKKIVPERSGLNQWNAAGRPRDLNEVYIPIPAWIHDKYPDFFPDRDEPFTLILPNETEMISKVCQDGSKALMSNPNSALGEWLLRDALDLKEGELLTYEKLEKIGLDSVVIYKTNTGKFDIDFTKLGSFEEFKENAEIPESED